MKWQQLILSIGVIAAMSACDRSTPEPPPQPQPGSQPKPPATAEVRETAPSPGGVVERFGERMKQVSTTAPKDAAAESIHKAYEGLVRRELLETWAAAPEKAPGRQVSSPWPDRIEVKATSVEGTHASVDGELVEATSTGEARRIPVQLKLALYEGNWLITAYEEAHEESSPIAAVIEDYYRAISARDFKRAYRAWGENGPPGQDYATFVKGFEGTASVEVETGTPSRIEPAAGSRYVTVPVTITATTTDGKQQRFGGTYTLRRSVVDGASEAQRKWHLYRASIRAL